jgi:hypothetical protein
MELRVQSVWRVFRPVILLNQAHRPVCFGLVNARRQRRAISIHGDTPAIVNPAN